MPITEMALFQRRFGEALAASSEGDASVLNTALARALAVHRNTAAKAAQDALAANYPVVRMLLGGEPFFACAAAFVRRHSPREARLNSFGQGFDAFLRSYSPAKALYYLPDVARLERLCTEALFAADAEPLTPPEIADCIAEGIAPRLHPAARFEQFASPAVSIWQAHQRRTPSALASIIWSPEGVLVTRPFGEVHVIAADPGLLAFLQASASGVNLQNAAEAADAVGADLSALLPTLIAAGAFA